MVPDIERQWIAEEQRAESPKPRWFLALAALLLVFLYWRCCG
jgi:hypothetical protein